MIRLYQGKGAADFEYVGAPTPPDGWAELRQRACRLLRARKQEGAAKILDAIPFELSEGTNFFGDEFSLLCVSVDADRYVKLAELGEHPVRRFDFQRIAETISELGTFVRFVVADVKSKVTHAAVKPPTLLISSDAVERALKDAEHLIRNRGATSGVDRVHTAFHGYLRVVCERRGIELAEGAGATRAFKALREHHPAFREEGPRADDIERMLRAMATVVDCLNPLRNRATLAHPNESVLEEPEAMLVINSIRTLLHYLDSKLR